MSEAAKLFLGVPERWTDGSRWRCEEGHVSARILKSEALGDLCLACQAPVQLTFPEDEEGSVLGAEVYALRRDHAEELARGRQREADEVAGPPVDAFMTEADLTAAADLIREKIDWSKLPKLAPIFEQRPSVNRYWHELVALALLTLEYGPRQWTEARKRAEVVVDAAIGVDAWRRETADWDDDELAALLDKLRASLIEQGFIDEKGEKL